MNKRKKRKIRKSIIIDKKKQPDAEQLIKTFKAINDVEINVCEKTGLIHVNILENSLKMAIINSVKAANKKLCEKK